MVSRVNRYGSRLRTTTLHCNRKEKGDRNCEVLFFDVGVVRILRHVSPVAPEDADFGEFFEHFMFMELRGWIDYRRPTTRLSYWRSNTGFEVDFILDDNIAVEVKSASVIHNKHLKGLKALKEERIMRTYILVCREPRQRLVDDIVILPWQDFLYRLWSDDLLEYLEHV